MNSQFLLIHRSTTLVCNRTMLDIAFDASNLLDTELWFNVGSGCCVQYEPCDGAQPFSLHVNLSKQCSCDGDIYQGRMQPFFSGQSALVLCCGAERIQTINVGDVLRISIIADVPQQGIHHFIFVCSDSKNAKFSLASSSTELCQENGLKFGSQDINLNRSLNQRDRIIGKKWNLHYLVEGGEPPLPFSEATKKLSLTDIATDARFLEVGTSQNGTIINYHFELTNHSNRWLTIKTNAVAYFEAGTNSSSGRESLPKTLSAPITKLRKPFNSQKIGKLVSNCIITISMLSEQRQLILQDDLLKIEIESIEPSALIQYLFKYDHSNGCFNYVESRLVDIESVNRIYRSQKNDKFNEYLQLTISKHKGALLLKRKRSVSEDDYGNIVPGRWNSELDYFVKNVLMTDAYWSNFISEDKMVEDLRLEINSILDQHVNDANSHEDVDSLDPLQYEHHCADLLRRTGWDVRVTQASGDQGIDLIANRGDVKAVFQCKKYSQPVGNGAVQEIIAGKQFEQAHIAAVVSNAPFTTSAKQLANATGVYLLHHDDLLEFAARVAEG